MNKLFLILTLLVLAGCSFQGAVIEPSTPTGMTLYEQQLTFEESVEQKREEQAATNTSTATQPTQATTKEEVQSKETSEKEFEGFSISYVEGDFVKLSPQAIDPDGDVVTYSFSKPLNAQGTWQTTIGDEGTYLITITASDGDLHAQSNVQLIIERANRAPVIDCDAKVVLHEGERFFVGDYCTYYDEDEEDIVVQYAGWPGTSRYTTTFEDAGEHVLHISARDATHVTKHSLPLVVKNTNREPTFPEDFTYTLVGMEGDIFTIDTSKVQDPDGDKLNFAFSSPFNEQGVWKTALEDAGTYDVDVVVSDGESTSKETITVQVQLANTKPTLAFIPDIRVKEGEEITLPISATDREGDALRVDISGFMQERTYKTTYSDAGSYTTKITVTDGEFVVEQVVHITIENVNRAPEFVVVQ